MSLSLFEMAVINKQHILLIYISLIFLCLKKFFDAFSINIEKKSKEVYFYTYVLVIFLVGFESLILILSKNNELYQSAIILVFIYATALMVLFLIFLALTTSESYHDKNYEYSIEFKIGMVKLTHCIIVFFWLLTFFYLSKCLLEILYSSKARLWQIEWFNIQNTKLDQNLKLQQKINYENIVDKKHFFTNNASLKNSNWVKNNSSIFLKIQLEILDEYVNYTSSAVLQSLCLILVIITLIL